MQPKNAQKYEHNIKKIGSSSSLASSQFEQNYLE